MIKRYVLTMNWKNSRSQYGLVAIILHWFSAIMIIGLLILGIYMVELNYYHPLYHKAPDVHRSMGILVAGILLIRFFWRLANPRPAPYGSSWEKHLGCLAHRLFYVFLFIIIISGYLISTADGKPISVFDWVQIPASITSLEQQEDQAGLVHKIVAYLLILFTLLHTAASLKHHFIDKDPTLLRMLGLKIK